MRLTLRTLLAYRDGVLSTADREDLHRRIQQSEDAGNLLKRVNATSKRIYGASPTIVGKGLGGDPNSLAEYLDDVLISEKVPELERICLESDVYLAELASCHTLLSTAMSTRVNVPNSLRQLAIDIGSEERRGRIKDELNSRKHSDSRRSQIVRADSAHPSNGHATASPQTTEEESREHVVQVSAPMVATGGDTIKQTGLSLEGSQLTREVPEYLVGNNSTNWLIPLSIGALIALLGVLTWKSLGPLERIQELFASSQSSENSASNAAGNLVAEKAASDILEDPPEPIIESDEMPPGLPPAADSNAQSDVADPSETEPVDAAVPASETESASAAVDATGASDRDRQEAPLNLPPPSADNQVPVSPTDSAAQELKWEPQDAGEAEAIALAENPTELRLLALGGSVGNSDTLIFPPFYRTTFQLANGVKWTACGPTLLAGKESQPDELHLKLGRAILQVAEPAATNANTIIDTPVGRYALRLASQDSIASLEIEYRRRAHGALTDTKAFIPVLIVTAVNGQVSVSDSRDNSNVTLELGEGVAVVGDSRGKEFKLQSIPGWFRKSYLRPIDKLASSDFCDLLSAEAARNTPLREAIAELTGHPKPEVANLAVQTSMLLGDWAPFAQGFLDNTRFRNHWGPTLDLAQQILASEGDAELRAALSTQGAKGDAIFNMLVGGQTKEELEANGMPELVDYLDDDELANRVVASYLLQKLTGQRLGYLPNAPNRASVQQWRRELATNRLDLLPMPDVIYERAKP